MAIDPSEFHLLNVADSCAIWNVLSAEQLHLKTLEAGVHLCCTEYVHYECAIKPRSRPNDQESAIQQKYIGLISKGEMNKYAISLDDLQHVARLRERRRLSMGELSSLVFAQRTKQAFLTDDQGARKLAAELDPVPMVQTTPHLLAWLYYGNQLTDFDIEIIIEDHKTAGRPLGKYFREAVEYATQCKAVAARSKEFGS